MLPFVARRSFVPPKLAAFKPVLNLPAPPEVPATRAVPFAVGQLALHSTAPIPPAPPPPVFASALPATSPTAHAATLQTGSFAEARATALPAAAKLPVESGKFGTSPVVTASPDAVPQATLSAGFGSTVVIAPPHRPESSVAASNGFSGVAAEVRIQDSAIKPAATGAAFTSAATANPVRQAAAARQTAAEPLEILSKPRPAYTEEGRRARVEGDVVLEVLFTASGTLRVLRVVHGLGFGLEQNAIDAAANIRFRPAKEGGKPVDIVANVRISFQIAY